jgi:hypothetical protein
MTGVGVMAGMGVEMAGVGVTAGMARGGVRPTGWARRRLTGDTGMLGAH